MDMLTMRSRDECTFTDITNVDYVEFTCLYPSLDPLVFDWEKSLSTQQVFYKCYYDIMLEYPVSMPVIAVSLYAFLILWGKKYMMNRKPFQWRTAMACWNLILCVFSFMCVIRLVPHLMHTLVTKSIRDNLCDDPEGEYARGSSGLWVHLFVWSKFAELFDTVFIVAHKKPLIVLHWYHHISVLLYTWSAYQTKFPGAVYFMTINAGVHLVMYGYYFLMSIKMRPKWMNAMVITVAQISQMVVGLAVTVLTYYFYYTDHSTSNPCTISKANLLSAFLMYGSYLYLFMQFFVERYFRGNKKAQFAGRKVA